VASMVLCTLTRSAKSLTSLRWSGAMLRFKSEVRNNDVAVVCLCVRTVLSYIYFQGRRDNG
jgi:hypothetical protein